MTSYHFGCCACTNASICTSVGANANVNVGVNYTGANYTHASYTHASYTIVVSFFYFAT